MQYGPSLYGVHTPNVLHNLIKRFNKKMSDWKQLIKNLFNQQHYIYFARQEYYKIQHNTTNMRLYTVNWNGQTHRQCVQTIFVWKSPHKNTIPYAYLQTYDLLPFYAHAVRNISKIQRCDGSNIYQTNDNDNRSVELNKTKQNVI